MFKHNHSPLPTKSQQTGQGFVEYAIILLLVGIAVVVILSLLRPAIEDAFKRFVTNAPVAPPEIGPIGGQFTPRPGPTVAFVSGNFASSEAVPVATIIVSLSYPFDSPITVRVSTADDTGPYPATAGVDYEATSTTITFAPNETFKQVPITMINDGETEEDETILLRLDNASTPNVGGPAILTIQDDDIPPIFSFTVSTQVTEENLGSVDVVVTMDRIYNNAAAVDYTTQSGAPGAYVATPGGSCTGSADYATTSGTLNFPSGTISDTITIPLCDDGLVENTEVFQVLLSNPVAGGNPTAIGGTNPMSVNIIDDETPPNIQFAAAAYEVDEAGPFAELVVQLSRTYATEVRVDYATTNGPIGPTGAQAGFDYTQSNAVAIIPSGSITTTIYIPITDDGINEEPETFNVTLSNPNPGIIPIVAPNPAVVTIIDNDCGYGPYNIPADRIEAEHFLCDGEGVSYHDTDSVNSGGYPGRPDAPGVDLRENFTGSTSNNVDLGWTVAGEWLNYSFNASQSTHYDITVRASAAVNNASFRLLIDGAQVGNVIQVPNTGNINTYQNLSIPAVLIIEGPHTLRLEIVNGGANYDYIQMQLASGPLVQFSAPTYIVHENGTNALITVNLSFPTTVDVSVNYATSDGTATAGSDYNVTSGVLTILTPQTSGTFSVPIINDGAIEDPAETVNLTLSNPSGGQTGPQSTAVLYIIDDECSFGPYNVPSRVEAENFQCGGQGTAYNDTTPGNQGSNSYRFWESVDLYTGGSGIYVGNTANGEWLRYNINVPSAGYYNVGVRAAANVATADFSLQVEGSALYGPFDVPNTGSTTSFTTVMVSGMYLTAGQHTIRLNIIGNGATYDYLEFSTLSGMFFSLSDDNNAITWPTSGGTTITDVDREDIVLFSNNSYSLFFDGSDVGMAGNNLQDFQLMPNGTILMTFASSFGSYGAEDIVLFTPTSLGTNTSGTFSMYFDGSNFGLTTGLIDGFYAATNGTVLVSTVNDPGFSISGTIVRDEDIIRIDPTNGQRIWFVDGSDIDLSNNSENIVAFWVAGNGDIYFSTLGNFSVTGLSNRRGNDIARFMATELGQTTSGTFSLHFDGNNTGLSGELISGFFLIP